MKKYMRGIADPFTLGLIVALVGAATVTTVHVEEKSNIVQSAETSQSPNTLVMLNEDNDE